MLTGKEHGIYREMVVSKPKHKRLLDHSIFDLACDGAGVRRPAWVRKSGPFECVSLSNGYILVKPSWEQYGDVWKADDGGGPGRGRRRAAGVVVMAALREAGLPMVHEA